MAAKVAADPIKYARNSSGEMVSIHPLPDLGKRERSLAAKSKIGKLQDIFKCGEKTFVETHTDRSWADNI